jgi:hypothetical protein
MQQQQLPNVPTPVRLRAASVYAALLRLFGCFRVRNFHPRFLASPDPTRPDRPKFLLPTTRYDFFLLPSTHLLLLLLSTHLF